VAVHFTDSSSSSSSSFNKLGCFVSL